MMEAILRWEGDSEELLEKHSAMGTPRPPDWGSEHYAAIIDFRSGVHEDYFSKLDLDALLAFNDSAGDVTWVEAAAMLAACERLLEALHARTPDAEGALFDFVQSRIWTAEERKARERNPKSRFDFEDVDMTGRPSEEDWAFLIDVFTGFAQDIKDAMALGAQRVTIEYV